MALKYISALEAASLIKNGDQIGLSGFTPAGAAKATTKELAKIALAEHEAGRPFQVSVFTGASTGQSTDGDLAAAQAIKFRAPYTTNPDFRKHVNMNEIAYNDLHLSHMAQELRYGFYGKLNWGILEVCDIEEKDGKVRAYLTAAGGISPTVAMLAEHVILELNAFHSKGAKLLHDVYQPLDPPCRQPIPITKVSDRIGKPYVEIDPAKIVGVVECNIPDEARSFKGEDPITTQIGHNTAEFLVNDMKRGIIPSSFLPLQSGVGTTANANNIDYFKDHLTLRQSEISNSPEVIRRLGVIAINTAIEVDIYGNANSTQVSGTKMMNGIGGSGDFERNAYISIFTCPSTAKGGLISSIVPFVSHQDHSEHDVNVIVTEQGVADLRHKSPLERAKCIIENCAHPDYKQLLWDYLKIAKGGQTHHYLPAAFAFHDTLARKGDMHLTDFAEYVK